MHAGARKKAGPGGTVYLKGFEEHKAERAIMEPKSKRLFLVGLDGCTWKVLRPMMEKGSMPFLKSLYEGGVSADLLSTFPPVTAPAWISLATGLNPGRTGVYDFNNRTDFTYSVHAVNSSYFRGSSMWDILSASGLKVCVLYYPMLYPAYEINGCMVSGLGGFSDRGAFYPAGLFAELKDSFTDLSLVVDYNEERYDDLGAFWRDILEAEDRLFEIFAHVLRDDYDVCCMVISLTDLVQHRAWPLIEAFIAAEDGAGGEELCRFWSKLDSGLEALLEGHVGESDIIFVSDHGFGAQDVTFNLSRWLIEAGYSRESKGKGVLSGSVVSQVRRRALENPVLHKLARRLKSTTMAQGLQAEFETADTGIDIKGSCAFTLDHTIPFGAVYLNLAGREKNGFLSRSDYDRIRERLRRELADYLAANDLGLDAFLPEEIYHGSNIGFAPDLLFMVDGGRGVVVRRREGRILAQEPYSNRHLGSHRKEGIFLAHGPSIDGSCGGLGDMDILDVLPLCAVIAGIDLPYGVDGTLREDVLASGAWASRKGVIETLREKERIKNKIRGLDIS